MESLSSLIRGIVKAVLHLLTGKPELQRLTENYPAARTRMVQQVRKSIRRSKKLKEVRLRVVESCGDFSVKSMVRSIRNEKQFENPGIVFALGSLRRTNVGIAHLSTLASTSFGNSYDTALIELWDLLRPGKTREGDNLRHSTSWSELGFQGLDPATDFRGGGMLSLENLRFFAKESGEVARRILNEQCRDITNGDFPFAITGINLTAFLLNLALRRKLDDLFLFSSSEAEDSARVLERSQRNRIRPSEMLDQTSESTPLLSDAILDDQDEHLDDDQTKTLAMERFNIAYSVVFTLFSNRWREAAPKDAMGFPLVFTPFKKEIEDLVSTSEGIRMLARVGGIS